MRFEKWLTFIILFLMFWLAAGCEKSVTEPEDIDPGPGANARSGAIIINEGNFLQGNASLDFYDADSAELKINVFSSVNSAALGDVANSVTLKDTVAYIVVNNSDRIEVISTRSFRHLGTIDLPPGASPRHMVINSSNFGFVTALYKNMIYVINLNALGVNSGLVDSVAVGANPEELTISGDRVYVANSGFGAANTVSAILMSNLQDVNTIHVGDGPQWIRTAPDGRLHVLCSGFTDYVDPANDTPGGVWVIDPAGNTVSDSLVLPVGEHPAELALADAGYFIVNNTVRVYNPVSLDITNSGFASGFSFAYGLGVDNLTQRLFVLDAVDFVSPGALIIYGLDGSEVSRYATGVAPGFIQFIHDNL